MQVLPEGPVPITKVFGSQVYRQYEFPIPQIECSICHRKNILVGRHREDRQDYILTGTLNEQNQPICYRCTNPKSRTRAIPSENLRINHEIDRESYFCDCCGERVAGTTEIDFLTQPVDTYIMVLTEKVEVCQGCTSRFSSLAMAIKILERMDLDLRQPLENEYERVTQALRQPVEGVVKERLEKKLIQLSRKLRI